MLKRENVRDNILQIYAFIEKDLKLHLRFKSQFIVEYFVPLLSMFFPFLIFNILFNIDENAFGSYYSKNNFVLFLLLAYCVECLLFLLWNYKTLFYDEKIWQTIKGVVIAPVSKLHLLFGHLIAGLIAKSFPIIIIIIICSFLFPIPFINLIFVLFILLCVSITVASIGFIIGLFEIINENISATLTIGISLISIVSCLFYPIEIFPESIRFLIRLNPLYYYFDLLRLSWWAGINYEEAMNYITIFHILNVAVFTILTPLFASYLFFKIYYKYGTRGY